MIEGFAAEALLTDRAFDTDAVVEETIQRGMKVVKRNENTTGICIKHATLWRMPFYISKGGVELRPVMQKEAILFLLPSKSDVSRYGLQ